jgi:hypothetical protein
MQMSLSPRETSSWPDCDCAKPVSDLGCHTVTSRRRAMSSRTVRGSRNFVMHTSRLANIENGNIVPGLHKFYTLAALYHLNPLDLFRWFEIPIEECFGDGINFQVPRTRVAAPASGLRVPLQFDPGFAPQRTDFLSRMVERWRNFEGALKRERPQHCYGQYQTGG